MNTTDKPEDGVTINLIKRTNVLNAIAALNLDPNEVASIEMTPHHLIVHFAADKDMSTEEIEMMNKTGVRPTRATKIHIVGDQA